MAQESRTSHYHPIFVLILTYEYAGVVMRVTTITNLVHLPNSLWILLTQSGIFFARNDDLTRCIAALIHKPDSQFS